MLKLGSLAALATAFVFAQLPLGGASSRCGGHDGGGHVASMADMAMSTPADASQPAASDNGSCDHCTSPERRAPSCDHTAALGGCMSMSSCASPTAEVASAAPIVKAPAMRVIARCVLSPPSPSLSQDTPPPRA